MGSSLQVSVRIWLDENSNFAIEVRCGIVKSINGEIEGTRASAVITDIIDGLITRSLVPEKRKRPD